MAKSYWNGILIGVALAVLAFYASQSIAAISFISTFINSISTWLAAQTWMSWYTFGYLNYVVAGTIGLLIGLWVEYK